MVADWRARKTHPTGSNSASGGATGNANSSAYAEKEGDGGGLDQTDDALPEYVKWVGGRHCRPCNTLQTSPFFPGTYMLRSSLNQSWSEHLNIEPCSEHGTDLLQTAGSNGLLYTQKSFGCACVRKNLTVYLRRLLGTALSWCHRPVILTRVTAVSLSLLVLIFFVHFRFAAVSG